jgi:hypothetical protein
MKFEQVLNGVVKYIDKEIYPGMNDWQEMLARIAVSRIIGNTENLKTTLSSNPFLRTFAIIDNDGNVDLESLIKDLKSQMEKKEKLKVSLSIFGDLTFTPQDVDKLYATIIEQ